MPPAKKPDEGGKEASPPPTPGLRRSTRLNSSRGNSRESSAAPSEVTTTTTSSTTAAIAKRLTRAISDAAPSLNVATPRSRNTSISSTTSMNTPSRRSTRGAVRSTVPTIEEETEQHATVPSEVTPAKHSIAPLVTDSVAKRNQTLADKLVKSLQTPSSRASPRRTRSQQAATDNVESVVKEEEENEENEEINKKVISSPKKVASADDVEKKEDDEETTEKAKRGKTKESPTPEPRRSTRRASAVATQELSKNPDALPADENESEDEPMDWEEGPQRTPIPGRRLSLASKMETPKGRKQMMSSPTSPKSKYDHKVSVVNLESDGEEESDSEKEEESVKKTPMKSPVNSPIIKVTESSSGKKVSPMKPGSFGRPVPSLSGSDADSDEEEEESTLKVVAAKSPQKTELAALASPRRSPRKETAEQTAASLSTVETPEKLDSLASSPRRSLRTASSVSGEFSSSNKTTPLVSPKKAAVEFPALAAATPSPKTTPKMSSAKKDAAADSGQKQEKSAEVLVEKNKYPNIIDDDEEDETDEDEEELLEMKARELAAAESDSDGEDFGGVLNESDDGDEDDLFVQMEQERVKRTKEEGETKKSEEKQTPKESPAKAVEAEATVDLESDDNEEEPPSKQSSQPKGSPAKTAVRYAKVDISSDDSAEESSRKNPTTPSQKGSPAKAAAAVLLAKKPESEDEEEDEETDEEPSKKKPISPSLKGSQAIATVAETTTDLSSQNNDEEPPNKLSSQSKASPAKPATRDATVDLSSDESAEESSKKKPTTTSPKGNQAKTAVPPAKKPESEDEEEDETDEDDKGADKQEMETGKAKESQVNGEEEAGMEVEEEKENDEEEEEEGEKGDEGEEDEESDLDDEDEQGETQVAGLQSVPSVKKIVKKPAEAAAMILDSLGAFYKCTAEQAEKSRVPSAAGSVLPADLISTDTETVWQQILFRNEHLHKHFKKVKKAGLLEQEIQLIGEESEGEKEGEEDEEFSDEEMEWNGEEMDEEEQEEERVPVSKKEKKNKEKKKKEKSIFEVNDEDLRDLDAELAKMAEEGDDEGEEEEMEEEDKSERKKKKKKKTEKKDEDIQEEDDYGDGEKEEEKTKKKKYRKSAVDDRFFCHAEMDEFLDRMDQEEGAGESAGLFDTIEDNDKEIATYRYSEFFGAEEGDPFKERTEKKKKKQTDAVNVEHAQEEEGEKKKKKKKTKVHFADDVEEAPPTSYNDDVTANGHGEEEEERVLLGPVEDDDRETQTPLKANVSKIKKTIERLEEKNLSEKPWLLSGEASAADRHVNTLLESHLDFDHGAKRAPEITEEFNAKIEALILQRVKDKAYDDPVRVVRSEERTEAYRNQAIDEELLVKKSLTEVYEKEYEKAQQNGSTSEEKPDERYTEIEALMTTFYSHLDALTHFQFTPPAAKPEVKIITNTAALRVEEVGATASTEEQLLAPEEAKLAERGQVKGQEEREDTDKKRERRKKKMKQRAVLERHGEEGLKKRLLKKKRASLGEEGGEGDEKGVEGGEKKKKKRKAENGAASAETSAKKFKSVDFAAKLQETVRAEIEQKITKKMKKKGEQAKQKSAGAKYKL